MVGLINGFMCLEIFIGHVCDYICTLQHNSGDTIKEILDQPSISRHVTLYGQ